MSVHAVYNTYTTLPYPTYKYDPIVNFQVRMVKWLATTSFIKDIVVVSQLFLLTYYIPPTPPLSASVLLCRLLS